MTNKTVISNNVAFWLKGKGYNEATQYYYLLTGNNWLRRSELKRTIQHIFHNKIKFHLAAPTIEETKKWLKDKYNIECDARPILGDFICRNNTEFYPYAAHNGKIIYCDRNNTFGTEARCYDKVFEYILQNIKA